MSATEIMAGRAFVEMLLKDESVQKTLDDVRLKLRSFGAAVDLMGSQPMSAMGAVATASVTRVGTTVGLLTASVAVLRSMVYAAGNAFQVAFGIVTSSVAKAAIGIGAIAFAVGKVGGKDSKIGGLLNGFLSQSQTTEAAGRWTRFLGMITGSQVLKGIGNQIERVGLGASIVQGFRSGGVIGGITSTFGAAFRSVKSTVVSTIGNIISTPIRLLRGVGLGAASSVPQVNALTGAITKTSLASRALGGTRTALASVASSVQTALAARLALAAAISGPAVLAAKSFATSAAEISKEAKDTGKSIQELVRAKYGEGSLISTADIQAGKELADLMKTLKQSVATVWAQIGIAALPVLKQITQLSISAAQAISGVLASNRGLVTSFITGAAKIATGVGAFLAVWKAAVVLGPALAFLTSPLGLIVAGVVAIALVFPQVRTAAVETFQYLFGNLGELLSIVQETAQGIMDALAGGSIEQAGKVLWAGLRVAWLMGTAQIGTIYRQMVAELAGVGLDMWAGLQSGFVIVMDFLQSTWQTTVQGFVSVWNVAQDAVAGGLARVIAKLTGQNVSDVLSTLNEMQSADASSSDATFRKQMADREALTRKRLEDIETERKESRSAVAEDLQARERAARADLDAAKLEFSQAKEAAAALKAKRFAPVDDETRRESFSGQMGTFSAAISGRIGIASTSPLQKGVEETARNTAEIAANTRNMSQGIAFS